MERNHSELTELDEIFLARACELAARALGNTAPNPPVGAVVVRDGSIAGEGYHHRAGEPHAEVHALRQAGDRARGATIYVSLEPCAHAGKTPPCTQAVVAAGITRVVAGTGDPTGHGGATALRAAGVAFVVADDSRARELVELFAGSYPLERPYLAVKMATSLDGTIAERAGVRRQLTGEAMRRRVRELRIGYDAVMVGAGTVRVDDPLLTVRPQHDRLRPYTRVIVCGKRSIPISSRVFDVEEGYRKTIVFVPGALASHAAELSGKADVIAVGGGDCQNFDLAEALRALRERGIFSVLCEGGPALATSLIAGGFADKFYWAIAPSLFGGTDAVRAFGETGPEMPALQFERVERLGDDVLLEGRFVRV